MLSTGEYVTEAGSTLTVARPGSSLVWFDWVEEEACFDCKAEPYDDDGYLVWHCNECGGGKAKLKPST